MSYGHILALKKENHLKIETQFRPIIVVGDDLFAMAAFHRACQKYGADKVSIISSRPFEQNDLRWWGPSALRGTRNIEAVARFYPDLQVEKGVAPSVFYKDMKFRKFGGRSKSGALQFCETFYTDPRTEIDWNQLFPFLKEDGFLEGLNQARIDGNVSQVKKVEPEDLVEPVHFHVTCTQGITIQCTTLYWAQSPKEFLEHYAAKNELPIELVEYCDQTHAPLSLVVRFEFEEVLMEEKSTLFIPLSYTHEWGHFIGEFHTEENKQWAEFVTFMDPDQTNEEEVGRKIRILKRQLEKICEKFKTISYSEYIKIMDNTPSLILDKDCHEMWHKTFPHLKMVSVNAPIERLTAGEGRDEILPESIHFLARGLVSLAQHCQ